MAKKCSRDTSVIPKGYYCYDEKVCPYWRRIKGRPAQECGYCDFLGEGDAERNARLESYDTVTKKASPLPFPVSLLWDQCKECGINHYTDQEIEQFLETGKWVASRSKVPFKLPKARYVIREKKDKRRASHGKAK